MWPCPTASAAPSGMVWCSSLLERSHQFTQNQAAHVQTQRGGFGSVVLCRSWESYSDPASILIKDRGLGFKALNESEKQYHILNSLFYFKMTALKDQRLLTQIWEWLSCEHMHIYGHPLTINYRVTICGCGIAERKEHLPSVESSLVLGLSQ